MQCISCPQARCMQSLDRYDALKTQTLPGLHLAPVTICGLDVRLVLIFCVC
jgi:hypothetical protein